MTSIELKSRAILIELTRHRRFQILTPHAIASVRGTIFAVDVTPAQDVGTRRHGKHASDPARAIRSGEPRPGRRRGCHASRSARGAALAPGTSHGVARPLWPAKSGALMRPFGLRPLPWCRRRLVGSVPGWWPSGLANAPLLDRAEALFADVRLLIAGRKPPLSDVVIVAIDDATVANERGYPIPRSTLARLIRTIGGRNRVPSRSISCWSMKPCPRPMRPSQRH